LQKLYPIDHPALLFYFRFRQQPTLQKNFTEPSHYTHTPAFIMGFFQSRFFEPTWKNKVLILQVAFTVLILIFGIAKVATTPSHIPFNRMDIVSITMVSHPSQPHNPACHSLTHLQSIKSGLFLTYEIVTMKVDKFKRFGSLKAYAVLNSLDVFFWAAVMGFSFKSVDTVCSGANCAIGVVTGLMALVNSYVTILSRT
jgi:hypothetical protein